MANQTMLEILAQIIEYLRGMWRYRWHAIAMAWAVFLLGAFAVYLMPDTYRATARIYVDTENTLRPLMRGLYPDTDMMSEVALMTRAVLFRDNINKVAIETDLIQRAKTPEEVESLLTDLQRRISVAGSGEGESIFTISFEDPNRGMSLDVVEAVVDSFLENSLQENRDDKRVAGEALEAQIRESESLLGAKDEERKRFKQENYQYLGSQGGDYYSQLQQLDAQIQATQVEIRLKEQRRQEVQRQLKGEAPTFGLLGSGGASGCGDDGKIAELENTLRSLQLQFTDKHPDIVAIRETIADIEAQCEAEMEASMAASDGAPPIDNSLIGNQVYDSLRMELSQADIDLATLRASLVTQQSRRAELESMVDRILEVEKEWQELNRGYSGTLRYHEELLERERALATLIGMENRSQGVSFREIDPAFASFTPTGPNRPLLLSAVLVMALGLGVALALLLSQMRPVFYSRSMLRRLTGLPVLGSVSLLLTPEQRQRRLIGNIGLTAVAVGLFTAFGLALILADKAPAVQVATGVQLL